MWSIPEAPEGALFVRIAAMFADHIRRGALRAGDRLPSTRLIARQLRVNRNTIVAAYDDLAAQGWVVARGPAGTYVANEMPDRAPRRAPPAGMAARTAFELRVVPAVPSLDPGGCRYLMSVGVPDTRLVPRDALARAYRRALHARSTRSALDYGDPRGTEQLRGAIAAMLREQRAVPVGADNILVTHGSQMALDLAARLLLRPGDVAAVEELGYPPAWRALANAGAELAPVPLDDAGLKVEALGVPRLVYVTPHHQYPTTVLLSPARRLALLELARTRGFAIVEDDYDHEFHFEGRPVAPLASIDRGATVLYIGSFSKLLAPGLRLGYIAACERVIERLATLRSSIDRMGDQVLEHAVAELIEDGELRRHARKARRAYAARREAMASLLARELGGALTVRLPPGGITLWAKVAPDVRLDAWRERARAHGVAIATARQFDLNARPRPYLRLAYAYHDESELADAIRRLRKALAEA